MSSAADFPIGSTVATDVYSIGGRCERVTGVVVEHWRGFLIVRTKTHGNLALPRKAVS